MPTIWRGAETIPQVLRRIRKGICHFFPTQHDLHTVTLPSSEHFSEGIYGGKKQQKTTVLVMFKGSHLFDYATRTESLQLLRCHLLNIAIATVWGVSVHPVGPLRDAHCSCGVATLSKRGTASNCDWNCCGHCWCNHG